MLKKTILLFLLLNTLHLFSYETLKDASDTLEVYFEKDEEGGYIFYADNNHFINQFVSLAFPRLLNLSMDRENPSKTVLEPGAQKVLIAKLKVVDITKSYSFNSRLSSTLGDPLTVAPDDFVYIFPFEHGTKHKLDQGYGGSFSHRDENYYALDFSMDIGTNVVAARDGIVIEVKEDSNRGGASSSYASYGNFIAVYHSDGTFASYVHLKQNGALVEVGDSVKQGDIIGLSGNTGLSTGPHLHFSVNIPTESGSRQSIPIKMIGLNGDAIDPVAGEFYYSMQPGLPEFDTVFGKDIQDSDYDGYSMTIPENGKIDFRAESVDSTTVIFCRNGHPYPVEGKVSFSLNNSVLSRDNPVSVEIPPLTEIFIGVVKPRTASRPSSFSYTISYRVLN